MAVEAQVIPEELFRQVQREFLEMPGLRLTERQACRLWGLDRDVCAVLLDRLVDEKFLTRTRDGRFMQLDRTQAARRVTIGIDIPVHQRIADEVTRTRPG